MLTPRLSPRSSRWAVALTAAATALAVASGGSVAAAMPAAGFEPDAGSAPDSGLPPAVADAAMQAEAEAGEPLTESPTGRWLVQLAEPSLAGYSGGLPGLAGTSPAVTGAESLDVAAPASRAYLDHLAQRQVSVTQAAEALLERPVELTHSYRHAANAVVVAASAAEAAALATLPGVSAVTPDEQRRLETDVSQELIGSPAVWDGQTGPDLPTRGEGVIVGLLDSGVSPRHPAFAETASDGFTHTNPFGSGNFVGVCDPDHPEHEDICNDKLIGAYSFLAGTAQDVAGHGSHVASTIAGNPHPATVTIGGEQFTRTVQGVAPRANIISYRVCAIFCSTSGILAAVDQAIVDGVDVLNYSISGRDDPWRDPVDLAFLDAFSAGIFISASAGNSGPGDETVAKTGPWNASVAASTTGRVFANQLDVSALGAVPVLAWPAGGPPLTGDLAAELRFAEQEGSARGCSSFPADAFAGRIALVEFGGLFDCDLDRKVGRAAAAGAVAVLLYEAERGNPPISATISPTPTVPAFVLDGAATEPLRQLVIGAAEPVQAVLGAGTELVRDPRFADLVAWFSSRGPSQFDLLAPTFAAPGVNILAADMELDGNPQRWAFLRGTSMAAPHGTGAGALLTALHPEWTPAQIRSALAVTANPAGLRSHDGQTAATPFEVGSGRLDLAAAGRVGLVLDETHANFLAANPREDGDPRTLNVPSMVDQTCSQECSWTRVVTSVADAPASYTAQTEAADGMSVTVTPSEFTIAPGESQSLEFTADVSGLPAEWVFGSVTLATGDQHAGGAPIASAHFPVTVIPVAPALLVRPAELATSVQPGRSATLALALVNDEGDGELRWQLAPDQPGCDFDDADWLTATPQAGTAPPGGADRVRVALDSAGLPVGEHSATLCVASNDPELPLVSVPVTLEVRDEPVIEVGQAELTATQPAGTLTATTLTIGNRGTAPLTWELGEAEVGEGPPGVDPERLAALRRGLVLGPDPGTDAVAAFDLRTGDLVDTEFIPPHPDQLRGVINHAMLHPDGESVLVSVQTGPAPDGGHVVQQFDLNGEYLGVFAPAGGQNLDILRNIRGMAATPWGTVLVTSADAPNEDAVAEFDADGNFLGNLVEPGAGGLDSPWSIVIRENDLLVVGSVSRAIHRYALDGTPIETFPTFLTFPQQFAEQADGGLLVAQASSSRGAQPGIYDLDADGNLRDIYTGVLGPRGVHELPSRNILASSGFSNRNTGVHEIDRAASIVDEKLPDQRVRFLTPAQLPQPCDTPSDVPWLDAVSPDGDTPAAGTLAAGPLATGTTRPGETSQVEIVVDSRGLAPGEHTAHLCVTSNDPAEPLVPVPVTVTVTEPACAQTITGTHVGAVRVSDGLLCLAHGSRVIGPVTVRPGAALHASGAEVIGRLAVQGATTAEVFDSQLTGGISVQGAQQRVTVSGNHVIGPVALLSNRTGEEPVVFSGNTVVGPLVCAGNQPDPVDGGVPNDVTGPKIGQCDGF